MRFYRALLRLYPAPFRVEYADEMMRVFEQRRRDAHGFTGVLGMWLALLADTIVSAAQTHWDISRQDVAYSLRPVRPGRPVHPRGPPGSARRVRGRTPRVLPHPPLPR